MRDSDYLTSVNSISKIEGRPWGQLNGATKVDKSIHICFICYQFKTSPIITADRQALLAALFISFLFGI